MITFSGISDVGRVRKNNEDAWFACSLGGTVLALVADGVGGRDNGEKASQAVAMFFKELAESGRLDGVNTDSLRDPLINMAIDTIHRRIFEQAQNDPACQGMACTLTLVVASFNEYSLYQIGDSRLYHLSQGALRQVSADQTLADDMFAAGKLTASQLAVHPDRNTLTQAIGTEGVGRPMTAVLTHNHWQQGDRLLLCSDGLSNMVDPQSIQRYLEEPGELSKAGAAGVLESLVNAANHAGGKDNITAVVVDLLGVADECE